MQLILINVKELSKLDLNKNDLCNFVIDSSMASIDHDEKNIYISAIIRQCLNNMRESELEEYKKNAHLYLWDFLKK